MATLSADLQAAIQVALGYGYLQPPHYELLAIQYQFTQAAVDTMSALLQQIADIDAKLTAATEDSMAEKVDSLGLNYRQHVKHLKSEGSRLLRQLSNVTGLKIEYNKYTTPNTAVTAYTNYW